MNCKKIGLGLSLSMAMGFMACGDDSSSPVLPANTTVGTESSSSVGPAAPESSADVASSSSVAEQPSSSSVAEAEPCAFAATDNVWTISYKGSDGKNSAKITTVYEINGDDLVIRDSIRYTGSMTSMMCSIDPTASNASSDKNFVGERSCDSDGNTVIYVSTTTQKGYFAGNARETFFTTVQNACKVAVNGGSYEKVAFAPVTKCDFAIDDAEWSYFYKDEGQNGDSIPMKKLLFPDPEDGRYVNMKYSIYPMSHIECVSKNFADFSGIRYCSADAFLNIASSTTTFSKESLFEMEQKSCKEFLPKDAVTPSDSSANATTASDSTATNTSVTDSTATNTGTTPTGDMVSCDIPGVLGECIEFPAGSDEAAGLTAQCVSLMEGTLGTGCAK